MLMRVDKVVQTPLSNAQCRLMALQSVSSKIILMLNEHLSKTEQKLKYITFINIGLITGLLLEFILNDNRILKRI